jgi:hypothetical protein
LDQYLAIEAENAVTLLPTQHQDPLRYLVARNVEHLYQQQKNKHIKHSAQSSKEQKTIKQIKRKLKDHGAIVTKTDKDNSMVILYQNDYKSKVQNFIDNNKFQIESTDPTNKFQAEVRKNINLCTLVIPKNQKWKYTNLNPSPPPPPLTLLKVSQRFTRLTSPTASL